MVIFCITRWFCVCIRDKVIDTRIEYLNISEDEFVGWQNEIVPFEHGKNDEMEKIMLWDMKEDIGYVDEIDVKIVQMVFPI